MLWPDLGLIDVGNERRVHFVLGIIPLIVVVLREVEEMSRTEGSEFLVCVNIRLQRVSHQRGRDEQVEATYPGL